MTRADVALSTLSGVVEVVLIWKFVVKRWWFDD